MEDLSLRDKTVEELNLAALAEPKVSVQFYSVKEVKQFKLATQNHERGI